MTPVAGITRTRERGRCYAHSNSAFLKKFQENYKKQVNGQRSNQLYQSAFPLKHIPEKLNFSYRLLGRNIFNNKPMSNNNGNFSDDSTGCTNVRNQRNTIGRRGSRRSEKRFKNYMRFQAQQGNSSSQINGEQNSKNTSPLTSTSNSFENGHKSFDRGLSSSKTSSQSGKYSPSPQQQPTIRSQLSEKSDRKSSKHAANHTNKNESRKSESQSSSKQSSATIELSSSNSISSRNKSSHSTRKRNSSRLKNNTLSSTATTINNAACTNGGSTPTTTNTSHHHRRHHRKSSKYSDIESKKKRACKKDSSKSSNHRKNSIDRKSSEQLSDNSSYSQYDLNVPLQSIGNFVNNREQMINQMFTCIKGRRLRAMLPDILKNLPLSEIKSKCLDQLECMSRKRILYILEDKVMTSSSGTDDSGDEADKINTNKSRKKNNENIIPLIVAPGEFLPCKMKPLRSLQSQESFVEDFTERIAREKTQEKKEKKVITNSKPSTIRSMRSAEEENVRAARLRQKQTNEVQAYNKMSKQQVKNYIDDDEHITNDFETYYNEFKRLKPSQQKEEEIEENDDNFDKFNKRSIDSDSSLDKRSWHGKRHVCSECDQSYTSSDLPSPSSVDSECSACEPRRSEQRSRLIRRSPAKAKVVNSDSDDSDVFYDRSKPSRAKIKAEKWVSQVFDIFSDNDFEDRYVAFNDMMVRNVEKIPNSNETSKQAQMSTMVDQLRECYIENRINELYPMCDDEFSDFVQTEEDDNDKDDDDEEDGECSTDQAEEDDIDESYLNISFIKDDDDEDADELEQLNCVDEAQSNNEIVKNVNLSQSSILTDQNEHVFVEDNEQENVEPEQDDDRENVEPEQDDDRENVEPEQDYDRENVEPEQDDDEDEEDDRDTIKIEDLYESEECGEIIDDYPRNSEESDIIEV